ncbi:PAS domain S-box protein [Microvirga pakistanensis]|uniref:PAS domain S-box protein n=1 Tax=Microvirga pakistanensis TaxID=1682650 RepID=UPI00106D3BCB|nr:sensor histidine kinase [Microvirga pakistanensis]
MDALFNQATVGLAECDLSGCILRANDYFCDMLARRRDQLLGRHLSDIVHPDDLPRTEALLAGLLTEDRYEVEKRYLRPDHTVVWTRTAASLIRDETGRPKKALAVCIDISANKLHEQILRESEERFRLLANSVPDLVWISNAEGQVTYTSERWTKYTGCPAEEALGDGWLKTVHPDDIEQTFRIWGEVRARGTCYETEIRYRRHDGVYRWHVVRANPYRHSVSGEILAWFGSSTDIHERKLTEAALRESEQRLRATYEQAAIGIAEIAPSGRLLRVNERLCAISGHARDELLAMTLEDITYPEDRSSEIEMFRKQMSGEIASYSLEKRLIHKDGHPVWIGVSASRVDDLNGRPLYGIRVIRDISGRKRAEASQDLLINELNHRVKNTLATVQSIARQTLNNARSPVQAVEDLENRLLALSRAHDVLTRENWEGARFSDIVAQAIAPYLSRGKGRFHVKGPETRLTPQQALALAMALQELAVNAAKYGSLSNDGGLVSIEWHHEAAADGLHLHLTWKESGGPPVEPPTRRGFGTRLIERSLARELEGQMKIDFRPEGVVFTANIPDMREDG